ncbi:MAG: peptide ABC transporter substrate-binding protein, partial [Simkaniaceae bacterium]
GYTELMETTTNCQHANERQALLRQSEQIIMNDMPVIPIFHFTMLYIQDDTLKDVVLTTMGNIDFKYAHIEKE